MIQVTTTQNVRPTMLGAGVELEVTMTRPPVSGLVSVLNVGLGRVFFTVDGTDPALSETAGVVSAGGFAARPPAHSTPVGLVVRVWAESASEVAVEGDRV